MRSSTDERKVLYQISGKSKEKNAGAPGGRDAKKIKN
jgi:hypothetical protein